MKKVEIGIADKKLTDIRNAENDGLKVIEK